MKTYKIQLKQQKTIINNSQKKNIPHLTIKSIILNSQQIKSSLNLFITNFYITYFIIFTHTFTHYSTHTHIHSHQFLPQNIF